MKIESQHIAAGLIAIIVPMVLGWLLRSRSSEARQENGIAWLYYGKALKGFALFFAVIVVGLVVIGFNVEPKDKMAVLGLIGLFGGLTLPLLLEAFFVRMGYDADNIYCQSIWRANRVIPWSEVGFATFSESMRWWVLDTEHSGTIRIHEFMSGLDEFLLKLDERDK